eukprot:g1448.t1 g1448   contig10:2113800-2114604(+)
MVSSNSILSSVLVGSAVGLSSTSSFVGAFQSQPQRHATPTTPPPTTTVFSSSDDDGVSSSLDISRRSALQKSAAVAVSSLFGAAVVGGAVQPSEASYSAYLHREEDWANRAKSGEIQYSNARQLRSQLREIAPMNDEGSKIFCPNGPSAAVSPLMENKCGDRQALPSVYGRSDDAMGNSIPGFTSAGRGGGGASAAQLRADLAAQSYFRSE